MNELSTNHLERSRLALEGSAVTMKVFDKNTKVFDEMSQRAVVWPES